MQPYGQYPPMPGPPLPPPAPAVRWWLFPLTTIAVVALQALAWARPELGWLQAASGAVLVLALVGVGVCLVRAPGWRDARPVGMGLVWARPIGFTDLLVAFL